MPIIYYSSTSAVILSFISLDLFLFLRLEQLSIGGINILPIPYSLRSQESCHIFLFDESSELLCFYFLKLFVFDSSLDYILLHILFNSLMFDSSSLILISVNWKPSLL